MKMQFNDSLRRCPACKYTTNVYATKCPNDGSVLYMEHELAVPPELFQPLFRGEMRSLFLRNDRQFAAGEVLRIREVIKGNSLGNDLVMSISHVQAGKYDHVQMGIPEGFCIMSLKRSSPLSATVLCKKFDPAAGTCSVWAHLQPHKTDCKGNWLTCGAIEGKPDAPLEYFQNMGINAVDSFMTEIVCAARNYLCGMIHQAMNAELDLDDENVMDDPRYVEIEDGDAEEMRDFCEALVRNTLRMLGFPIADMDLSMRHELERPDEEYPDFLNKMLRHGSDEETVRKPAAQDEDD